MARIFDRTLRGKFLHAWRCWLSSRRLLILETTDSLPASRGEALSPRTAAALAGQPRAVIALHEAVCVQHKKIVQQKYELEREKSRATVSVRHANELKHELSRLRESTYRDRDREAERQREQLVSTPRSVLQQQTRRTFSASASPRTSEKQRDRVRERPTPLKSSGSARQLSVSLALSESERELLAAAVSELPLSEGVPPSSLYSSLSSASPRQTSTPRAGELSEMSKLREQAFQWSRAGD